MKLSEFIAFIDGNFLKAREKSRLQVAIGFGTTSHWLKKQKPLLSLRS